jgi:hypothetical protein
MHRSWFFAGQILLYLNQRISNFIKDPFLNRDKNLNEQRIPFNP